MAGTSLSSNVGHDFYTVGLTSIFPVETTVRRSLVGRLCPDRSAQVPRPTDAHRNQRSPSADTLWHTNSGCRQRRRNGPRWVRPQVINTLVRSYRACRRIERVDHGSVAAGSRSWGMAKSYRPVLRDQPMLMPVDMREWLPPDHLAWFVIDTIEALDTSALEGTRRRGGAGAAGYDPSMLLALLV